MSTLLYLGGFFVILLILKFVYDSYLTDNTEREWQKYKYLNPEKAKKIEGVGVKFDSREVDKSFDEIDKENSMKRLAEKYSCEVWEVKDKVLKEVSENKLDDLTYAEFKDFFKEQIEKESRTYQIKPINTSSEQISFWIEDYLFSNKWEKNSEIKSTPETFLHFLSKHGIDVKQDFVGLDEFYNYLIENIEEDLDDTSESIYEYLAENFSEINDEVKKRIIFIGLKLPSDPFVRGTLVHVVTDILKAEFFKSDDLQILKKPEIWIKECLVLLDHKDKNNYQILADLYNQLNNITSFNGNQDGAFIYSMRSTQFKILHDKNSK